MSDNSDIYHFKKETDRFLRSVELIAKQHEPDKRPIKKWFQELLWKYIALILGPQFIIGTLIVGVASYLIASRFKAIEDNRQLKAKQIEILTDTRAEVQETLGNLAKENAQFLALTFLTNLIANESDINQGYLSFNFRSTNDLKLQRVITLVGKIERLQEEIVWNESESELKKLMTDTDVENIHNRLLIGLILAQNANVISGNYYLCECVEAIDDRIKNLNAGAKEKEAAEREILQRIALQAETIRAVLKTVNLYNDPLFVDTCNSQELETKINKIFEVPLKRYPEESKTIRAAFMRAIVHAIKALLAESIAQHRVKYRPMANNISGEFLELCSSFDRVPSSEYLNYIDFIREFVFVSACKILLERAEDNLDAGRAVKAKEDLDQIKTWSNHINMSESMLVKFDMLYLKTLSGLNNLKLTVAAQFYRQKILEHFLKTDVNSSNYLELQSLLIKSTVGEISRIIAENNQKGNSQRANAARQLESLFQDLETANAIWFEQLDLQDLRTKIDAFRLLN